jgi:hypothetical protein
MEFAVFVYGDEEAEAALTPEDRRAIFEQHMALGRALEEAGVLRRGAGLAGSERSQVLRRRGGRVVTTDGPFAETKEQLGGFYVLECADEAEALRWAEQMPVGPGWAVEVRPVVA